VAVAAEERAAAALALAPAPGPLASLEHSASLHRFGGAGTLGVAGSLAAAPSLGLPGAGGSTQLTFDGSVLADRTSGTARNQ